MESQSLTCRVIVILSCFFLVHCKVIEPVRIRRASPALPKENTTERLQKLREQMKQNGVQAYIIPSVDQHMSGSGAPHFQRRQYISGFTGSRGEAGTPTQAGWLAKELRSQDKVGVDPYLISIANYEDMSKELQKSTITLKTISQNLVDAIWTVGRPPLSNATIYPLEMKFTGKTWSSKIADLRDEMASNDATAVIVYQLDEVAWLLNLRGADLPSSPFFFAFVIVTASDTKIYIEEGKLTSEAKTHLNQAILRPYNITILNDDIKAEGAKSNAKIWLSPFSSYGLKEAIPQDLALLKNSPIALPKSIKNPTEIEGMKKANLKDSTAMVEFFCWLKNEVPKGRKDLTEFSAVKKLEEFKSEQDGYMGYSFNTIAGFGSNGAIIHYRPEDESTSLQITDKSTFLVDSGSQFKDGTTDTTRTVHFGTPTAHQKDAYTRILKGQIALALTVFPNTTQGRFLDVIARSALWQNGLDYRHGTGHGIGMFLGVHEGPQIISIRCPKPWEHAIVPGMFQSDEPGYYEDGKFGIRLEIVLVAVPAKTQNTFNDKQYVAFEAVSFVPYWKSLINLDIMTPTEIKWLNNYHKQCREKIGKMLKDQNKNDVYDWLVETTEPLEQQGPKAGTASLKVSTMIMLCVALSLFLHV